MVLYKINVTICSKCGSMPLFEAPQVSIRDTYSMFSDEEDDGSCCLTLKRGFYNVTTGDGETSVDYSCETPYAEKLVASMISRYFGGLGWTACSSCNNKSSMHRVTVVKQVAAFALTC